MSRHRSAQGGAIPRILQNAWLALLVVTLLSAVYVGWERHAHEWSSRRISIVVDAKEVKLLADIAGIAPEALLLQFADAGVHAVGVHEYTLRDAIADGRVFFVSKRTLDLVDSRVAAALPPELPPSTLIVGRQRADQSETGRWLSDALGRELGSVGSSLWGDAQYELWVLPRERVPMDVGLGFLPADLAAAHQAGLGIVPRLVSDARQGALSLDERVDQLRPYTIPAIIFWGSRVSGYPDGIPAAARSLKLLDAPLGLVEFAEQSGAGAMAKALEHRIVRVHSITDREMAVPIDVEIALDRWLRAARERGVRLLYTRLYLTGPAAEQDGGSTSDSARGAYYLEKNRDYLAALGSRLHQAEYEIGDPHAVPRRPQNLWALAAAVLTAGSALGAVAGRLADRLRVPRPLGLGSEAMWIVGGLVLSLFFWLLWLKGYTVLGRQVAAFAAALAFPTLAVATGWRRVAHTLAETNTPQQGRTPTTWFRTVLLSFLQTTGWTLLGVAVVVVLLDDVRFAAAVEGFRGVKAAHVLPLLILAALLWPKPSPERQRGLEEAEASRVWWIAIGTLAGVALAVYVLRTGNQGLPLWDVEDAARRFLEETFVARPRTKEFLVGHPALVLSFFVLPMTVRRPHLAMGAAILGAIGQISILNTFAHAHSPIAISLMRTGYGLLLGLFLGFVAALVVWGVSGALGHRPEMPRSRTGESVE